MLKKLLLTTLSIAAFSAAASVNAATYNFVDLIEGGSAPGSFTGVLGDTGGTNTVIPTGEAGYQTFTWTVDGLALTATATKNGAGAFAYLDAGTAGLGVCGTLATLNTVDDQCNPRSDDNVTLGELLNISFDQTVSIDVSNMVFRDGGHAVMLPTDNSGLEKVLVDVDGTGPVSIKNLVLGTSSIITGTEFIFAVSDDTQQFYISSLTAVPIPAAAWLFGSALIGLAGVARKRKVS